MHLEAVELISKEQVDKLVARVERSKQVPSTRKNYPERSPISGTLDPYSGPWETEQAAHLLRRTMIGPSRQQIAWAVDNGMQATIEKLLEDQPLPEPPINYYFEQDPFTEVGETWIDKPFLQDFIGYRMNSLFGWTYGLMFEEGISIRERMTLFWHNHFVTSEIPVPKMVYQYITLLRSNALGNFKELTKEITIDPSMLFYLNGNQNTKFAPNENYARELLELFTVGKGELAAPGDYTTFTEEDVKEIARVLTGWRIRFESDTGELPHAIFNEFMHDEDSKQLSARFGNAVIENAGEDEYKNLIEIIFEHPEAARYICKKLYRWFVYYKIDEQIESDVIDEMATVLRDNDFEIAPVITALLSSQHFYDVNSIGCIIKSPIEFIVGLIKQCEVQFPQDYYQKYATWTGIFRIAELLQMVYYYPPSVAGWKAFYQEPTYNELWINSVTLITRQLFTDVIATEGFPLFDRRFVVDVLDLIADIPNAQKPNDLIRGIIEFLYPNPLSQEQIDVLKNILIPGLPDLEWTIEYEAYLSDPENDILRIPVEIKVRQLFRAMMARPEYHLA